MTLTRKQFDVLVAVSESEGSVTQRKLENRTGYSLGTVNRVLKELTEAGLIKAGAVTQEGYAALEPYRREGAAPISVDVTALARMGVRAAFAPVADYSRLLVRHDPMALANAVMELYRRISPTRIY